MESAALTRVPGSPPYLLALRADLLRFAARSRDPLGFGWLDDHGLLDPTRTVQLWITCRMTHVFSLAVLAAEPPAVGGPDAAELEDLAAHGVASLLTVVRRRRARRLVRRDRRPRAPWSTEKSAYAHAFVVLAASSAAAAGIRRRRPAARRRARRARGAGSGTTSTAWSSSSGTATGPCSTPTAASTPTCTRSRRYLAAADVTGDAVWVERAGRMARRLHDVAEAHAWRIPEHFDAAWTPLPTYNRDDAGRPVPAVRRDDRARARVGAAAGRDGGHRRGARTRRPGGRRRPDRRCRAARRSRDRRRAGRSTAPTASSTPPTGRAFRSCATACTGWWPRR